MVFPAVIMNNFRCHSVKRLCFTLNDLRVLYCQKQVVKLSYPLTDLFSCGSAEYMHKCCKIASRGYSDLLRH